MQHAYQPKAGLKHMSTRTKNFQHDQQVGLEWQER
ncbi:hypothetical protein PoMZ_13131 [Pyricularia oryzae]|uniref:Uncharacterized protein n=1 Tax=Pyricularia oryzae TaxID=318829 RepID=A0A4P7NUL7_PYROR|nr:hypothetical protein PoMZ_13131 [Pyricularia oryzae]